jgi:hypothetical protein
MAKQMGVPIGRLCAGVNINGEYYIKVRLQRRLDVT